jgi:hypothetical protein
VGGRTAITRGQIAVPGSMARSVGSHSGGASTNPASPSTSRGTPRSATLPPDSAMTVRGAGHRSTRQTPTPVCAMCCWTSGPGRSGAKKPATSAAATSSTAAA